MNNIILKIIEILSPHTALAAADTDLINAQQSSLAFFTDNKAALIWFLVGVFGTLIVITLIFGALKLTKIFSQGLYMDIQGTRYKTKAERDYANSIW